MKKIIIFFMVTKRAELQHSKFIDMAVTKELKIIPIIPGLDLCGGDSQPFDYTEMNDKCFIGK